MELASLPGTNLSLAEAQGIQQHKAMDANIGKRKLHLTTNHLICAHGMKELNLNAVLSCSWYS